MKAQFATVFMLGVLAASEAAASHLNPLAAPTAPWAAHIREVNEALGEKNVGVAERAWQEAYLAALGGRGWEGLLAVGDAARRIAAVAGPRSGPEAKVLQTYLLALVRARQQRSLDGVLRTSEAFASLGDREVVAFCIRIAESLTAEAHDARARSRLRALKEWTGALLVVAEYPRDARAQPKAVRP